MNKIKVIELAFLSFVGLANLLPIFNTNSSGLPDQNQFEWISLLIIVPVLMVLSMGIFYLMISGKVKDPKARIETPKLGNNPFNMNSPLDGIFLLALFFIIAGGSTIIAYLVTNLDLSQIGVISTAYGISLIGTIRLAISKRKIINGA